MDVLTGIRLLSLLRRLRKRDKWTRQRLHEHQNEMLRKLREYACATSPFYKEFHKGLANKPLHELPVLTKAVLMENFDELVTDRSVHLRDVEAHLSNLKGDELFLDRYRVAATSGSTGLRGFFLFNQSEWLTVLASFARAYEWAGGRPGVTRRIKTASIFSPVHWHVSRRVTESFKTPWLPSLYLPADDPLEKIVRDLNAFQPEMLACYTSIARILAKEQIAGSLNISPHHVLTGAEALTPDTRKRIEKAWGDGRLFDQYGATEGGNMAAECTRHEGLHLMEDLVIFEVVDRENRPVPAGAYGDKLLITVLFSRTQPLIRYELSDSIRLAAGDCPCGRPFRRIRDIQGRMEEMLCFPAVAGGEVTVNPVVFDQVMDTAPVGEWQVVHDAEGLNVFLSGVQEGHDDEMLRKALHEALSDKRAVVPPIRIRRVPVIRRGATGKAPLIKSKLRCVSAF
ncbi:MAG: phenylacetate--CoA ligase family protein [Nitrospirae bacterium]|nr:phenylacetate--CoA ligase family protein [Nitrospirota bacterium]